MYCFHCSHWRQSSFHVRISYHYHRLVYMKHFLLMFHGHHHYGYTRCPTVIAVVCAGWRWPYSQSTILSHGGEDGKSAVLTFEMRYRTVLMPQNDPHVLYYLALFLKIIKHYKIKKLNFLYIKLYQKQYFFPGGLTIRTTAFIDPYRAR